MSKTKMYIVSVYHYTAEKHQSELWLAYLRYHNPNSSGFVDYFEIEAGSGPEAKRLAIKEAKERLSK